MFHLFEEILAEAYNIAFEDVNTIRLFLEYAGFEIMAKIYAFQCPGICIDPELS